MAINSKHIKITLARPRHQLSIQITCNRNLDLSLNWTINRLRLIGRATIGTRIQLNTTSIILKRSLRLITHSNSSKFQNLFKWHQHLKMNIRIWILRELVIKYSLQTLGISSQTGCRKEIKHRTPQDSQILREIKLRRLT